MTTEQLTTLDRKQSVKMVEFNFLLKQTKKNPVGASFDLCRNLWKVLNKKKSQFRRIA